MKKALRFCFASFLVCLLTLATSTLGAQAEPLVIKVNNYTNNSISLAFARENGYNTSDTTTIGWYNCDAKKWKSFKIFNYNPNDNYYWYVVSRGNVIVSGKDFTGWIVRGKAFKSVRGRKLGGGMRVGFKALNEKQGRATINIGK